MAENYHNLPSATKSDNHNPNKEMTPQEKSQANRDRNREHARCTRLRKKAYVNKLKELVDGLHAERSEDARKRRVAVQHLAEIQETRRKVAHTFLGYHAKFERDMEKWKTILEEDFWLKQPVTPYRSFRRCEIQKGSRILKGIPAMIGDAASMSVMIETIGSRNVRWLHRKRDEFLARIASKYGRGANIHGVGRLMPHSIVRQNSRLQHAVSSLSSSSGSSTGNGSGSEEERQLTNKANKQQNKEHRAGRVDSSAPIDKNGKASECRTTQMSAGQTSEAKKVSSSSSSNDTRPNVLALPSSNDYHDYHAPSLPDPLLESGGSSPESDSPRGESDNCVVGKHACTDSSSGEEEKTSSSDPNLQKKQKVSNAETSSLNAGNDGAIGNEGSARASHSISGFQNLPTNQIARSGGILHNIKPVAPAMASAQLKSHARLSRAPATTLPPFVGLGKSSSFGTSTNASSVNQKASNGNGTVQSTISNDEKVPSASASSKPLSVVVPTSTPKKKSNEVSQPGGRESYSHSMSGGNVITKDNDTTTSSQSSALNQRGIQAYYHINEDDMILTDDVLMCPFIFRSQEAVWYGALAECVMPGMLRACYSSTNKLKSVDMIFDAMGFCQQLERASGNEGMAQIIPNSLEMALSPNKDEARVITLAKPPFLIVSVNEAWTRVTGYTQLDCEGRDLGILSGDRTDSSAGSRAGLPVHTFESVANGQCACSVNVHYDSKGREFLDFMCSYPLTNLNDEVTHILHICQELPGLSEHAG